MKLSFTNKPPFTNFNTLASPLTVAQPEGISPCMRVGVSRVQHAHTVLYESLLRVIEAGKRCIHVCLAHFDLLKNWVMKKPNHSKAICS